jgi:hypothetical protein
MAANDFAERLRNKETAKGDQADAASELKARQQKNNAYIYENAKSVFLAMQGVAEALADAANPHLSNANYTVGPIAGGFHISLGSQSAGFSYSQMYGNAGEIILSVLIQQRQSNFEMFGLPITERPKPTNHLKFVPAADAESNTLLWRSNGCDYSSKQLVEAVMTTLMDRA